MYLRRARNWMTFACFLALSSIVALPQTSASASSTPAEVRVIAEDATRIGRSDVRLARPNLEPGQAMPLGNGRLGVAVWSERGLTAQLNRLDTLPDRVPVARVVVPGLAALTAAPDYHGRLDLYRAEFEEQGGSLRATIYVDTAADLLVMEVQGANPDQPQTVELSNPTMRRAAVHAAGSEATVSDSWVDDWQPGASGRSFGSLAAITVLGRGVAARVGEGNQALVSFQPFADGHFRILVAAPHFDGKSGEPTVVAVNALKSKAESAAMLAATHREWWKRYWYRAGAMQIQSPDGTGEYMENLRALYLYSAAGQSDSEYPGSQAGIADLFSAVSGHQWAPASYWHWNLRMQVAANLTAGVPELNAPYFRLYRENLESIREWTRTHMDGRQGICIPETMRFNGKGIEYEAWDKYSPNIALDCDSHFQKYFNARTISTGAEVGLWVWQQYLATLDRDFLRKNYPLMAESARFLLAYESPGADGLNHTGPSNAHETQWDVTDPTTDLAARKALYPAVIAAAKTLETDSALVEQLTAAIKKIPQLPRTLASIEKGTQPVVLPPSPGDAGEDVFAASYQPAVAHSNVENIGLEPVWPYDLVGDRSPLFALARRTYQHRPYPTNQDWSFDPLQAARLQLPDEVRATLIKLTETYQRYSNGFARWGGTSGEFYIEQQAIVAAALQEALVQDYDGVLRIAPAFPLDWDVDGTVSVRGRMKVAVSMRGGLVKRVQLTPQVSGKVQVRNPWPGQKVRVSAPGRELSWAEGETITLSLTAGKIYRLFPESSAASERISPLAAGAPSARARVLGPVQIGLSAQP